MNTQCLKKHLELEKKVEEQPSSLYFVNRRAFQTTVENEVIGDVCKYAVT